jgi:hypothetical protein
MQSVEPDKAHDATNQAASLSRLKCQKLVL